MRLPFATVGSLCLLATAGCLDFDQFGTNGDGGNAPHPDLAANDLSLTVARDATTPPPKDFAINIDFSQRPDATNPGDLEMCKNGFLSCYGTNELICNDQGVVVSLPCGGQCVGPDNCGLCTPGMPFCDPDSGSFGTCTSQHGFGPEMPCPPPVNGKSGECADATSCAQCIGGVNGGFVCGDGNAGSSVNTQYACINGQLRSAVACAFGCDPKTAHCRDLVPANQAGQHLGQGDQFSCTNPMAKVSDLITPQAGKVVFDTGAGTISVNGAPPNGLNAPWGLPYTPMNGSTKVRVLHLHSLNVGPGSTVTVTGTFGLILLIDTDVTFQSGMNLETIVDLSAKFSSVGPGANAAFVAGAGGNGGSALPGNAGGGGAGHGTHGGNGGGWKQAAQAAGGSPYGDAVLLEAGTLGGSDGNTRGGGGGGALQVSACGAISIPSALLVNASGGGGGGGYSAGQNVSGGGGGGGGSGGTIILESQKISVAGELVANGGGGGSGGLGNLGNGGQSGGNWDPSGLINKPAAGGMGGGAAGGAGGALGSLPVDGTTSNVVMVGSGGGGGAVGRIFVNTSPTAVAAMPIAGASPTASISFTCVTDNGMAPMPCVYP